ncbi:MAG: formylglycine-generating enzyme family protein [Novosphingobium sp.]
MIRPALLLLCLPLLLAARPARLAKDCDDCAALAVVPAGTFQMGAEGGEDGRAEGPVHRVEIRKPFALAVTEVTNAQYARFVAESGHPTVPGCEIWPKGSEAEKTADWRDPALGRPTRPDEPVVCVSWSDARAYVDWLARRTGKPYRLPTEAEWEYAARAGTDTPFPWKGGEAASCAHANIYDVSAAGRFAWANAACTDGHPALAQVGSFKANAFGLFDMIGNVWEWTEDCYAVPYPVAATTEAAIEPGPGEACARRSVRGGSWMTRPDRNRVSFRGRDPEGARYFMFGFRVARDLLPGEAK